MSRVDTGYHNAPWGDIAQARADDDLSVEVALKPAVSPFVLVHEDEIMTFTDTATGDLIGAMDSHDPSPGPACYRRCKDNPTV